MLKSLCAGLLGMILSREFVSQNSKFDPIIIIFYIRHFLHHLLLPIFTHKVNIKFINFHQRWLMTPFFYTRSNIWSLQHPSFCFTAVDSGSCCWHFAVICLRTRELDSQDSTVWSGGGRRQTLRLPAIVEVFSLCRCVMPDFGLSCENRTEHDPTCYANNTRSHVSFVACSHNKHKGTL